MIRILGIRITVIILVRMIVVILVINNSNDNDGSYNSEASTRNCSYTKITGNQMEHEWKPGSHRPQNSRLGHISPSELSSALQNIILSLVATDIATILVLLLLP